MSGEFTPWLREHLAVTGAHLGDGYSRKARWSHCVDCHRPIVRGLDAPVLARSVLADAREIDELGEFIALTAGLATHHLMRIHNAWVITVRWPEHIRAGRRHPVIADHRCGFALPAAERPLLPAATAGRVASDEPPF